MDKRTPKLSRRTLLSASAVGVPAALLPAVSTEAQGRATFRYARVLNGDLYLVFDGRQTLVRVSAPGVVSVVSYATNEKVDLSGFFLRQAFAAETKPEVSETVVALRLTNGGVAVEVDKRSGLLRFFLDGGRRARIAEIPPETPIAGVEIASVQSFSIGEGERLHGLGQFREPSLDYFGRQILLEQSNMDAVNPFLVSTGGWGLLWDTGTGTYMRSEKESLSFHSVAGQLIRYHVVVGDGIDALIAGYRRLTGAAQLLSKWAYGYWQSRERYHTADELTNVVDTYRARGLPLDNIVLDWHYWGENDHFSGMTFDPVTFPDPKGMVDHVHSRDAHIIVSIWPAFGPATQIFRDMEAAGRLLPETHWCGGKVFDVTAPDARAIYWKHIDRGLMSIGMDGLWTDGCEPEFRSTGNRYVTARTYAANGREAAGPVAENLLTYSFYQSRGLSEAMRREYPDRRPFILTRSVYPGQQAFGAVTWSGDIFASWQTLRNQVVASLNMALSGNPHWTCDIGGFLVFHRYPRGLADPAYQELYVRWFQFGAFLPVFRAHGTDVSRELWQFGGPGDPAYDALSIALRRRYALMPYIYSVAVDAALNHGTITRALVMDFPNDAKACEQTAQYCFGRGLMVRVVDRPLLHASANIQEFLPTEAVIGRHGEPAAEVCFFEGTNFDKAVSRSLTDDLKMSWPGDLPLALQGKPYSVRWTGRIQAQETGRHEFVVTAQGAVRFILDGDVRILAEGAPVAHANDANGGVSAKNNASDRRYSFTIDLVAGKAYDFMLEQRQSTPDAVSLWVEWITPSQRVLATPPSSKTIHVYLPEGADWYDFDSGQRHSGGRTIVVEAALARMPIFARAGAIIPQTPGISHAMQKCQTIELHVFRGADGSFGLYDDSGDGEGYSRGEHAIVDFHWVEKSRTLTIAQRRGVYPGMPDELTFVVKLHSGGKAAISREVKYNGGPAVIAF